MKKIETITIDKQVSYVLTLQMILLFFIGGAIFTGITGTGDVSVNGWLTVIIYVATIVIHELVHGVGFLIARAKPRFGVGMAGFMPIAYATSDTRLKIPAMLLVACLPFVSISIFYIFIALWFPQFQSLALIGFLGNFTGAVGDIWIAAKLWKYLRFSDTMIRDTKSGIEIFSDNSQALVMASKSKHKEENRLRFAKQWVVVSLVMFGAQTLIPIVLAVIGYNESIKLGYGELYIFETTISKDGSTSSASFNLLAPIVVGLLFTMLSRLFMKFRLHHTVIS